MIYDIADGSFIQLQNNLSLRINGIPLAGMKYTDFIIPSIQNATVLCDVRRLPYQTFVVIRIEVDANKTLADVTQLVNNLPPRDDSFAFDQVFMIFRYYPSVAILSGGQYYNRGFLMNHGSLAGGSNGNQYVCQFNYPSLPT